MTPETPIAWSGRRLRLGSRGRDVLAMKRGLAQAGYGKLENLNGVFGLGALRNLRSFQAACGLEVSGVYGPYTHKKLALYFDDYATQLYADSYPLVRERALEIAVGEIGVHEIGTSNRGPRVDEYQDADGLAGRGYPWCMAFVQWCFKQAGGPLGNLTASVGFFADWGRRVGLIVTTPARGDVVCFNFDSDNWPDHVGLVRRVLPLGMIWTVEGNTSGTDAGSQDDGGAVASKVRRASRCVFVRVPGRSAV